MFTQSARCNVGFRYKLTTVSNDWDDYGAAQIYVNANARWTMFPPSNTWTISEEYLHGTDGYQYVSFNLIKDYKLPSPLVSYFSSANPILTNYYTPYSNTLSVVVSGLPMGVSTPWELKIYPDEYTNTTIFKTSFTNSASLTRIPTGSYFITFSSVRGYAVPPETNIDVSAARLAYSANIYVPYSNNISVEVIGYPAGNAAWTITGPTDFTNTVGYPASYTNNAVISGVPKGNYSFNFPGVIGYITPTNTLTIDGASPTDNSVTGIYVLAYPTNIPVGTGIQKFYQHSYFFTNVFLHDSGVPLHTRLAAVISSELDPIFGNWLLTNTYSKGDSNAVWGNISGTLSDQIDLTQTVALALGAYPSSNPSNLVDATVTNDLSGRVDCLTNWVANNFVPTNDTHYLAAIIGATIATGEVAAVITNAGILGFTVPAGGGGGSGSGFPLTNDVDLAGYTMSNGSFVGNGAGLTNVPGTETNYIAIHEGDGIEIDEDGTNATIRWATAYSNRLANAEGATNLLNTSKANNTSLISVSNITAGLLGQSSTWAGVVNKAENSALVSVSNTANAALPKTFTNSAGVVEIRLPANGIVYFGTTTNYIQDQAGTNFLFKSGNNSANFGW